MSEPLGIVNQTHGLETVDAGQNSERLIDQLTTAWPVSFGAFPLAIERFEFRDGNMGLPFPGKQATHGWHGDVATIDFSGENKASRHDGGLRWYDVVGLGQRNIDFMESWLSSPRGENC